MRDKQDDEYKFGLACIDVFSKYATAIALTEKTPEHLIEALKRVFHQMDGKPKVIVADEEGSMQSTLVSEFLKKENITYIITRNHAPFIERFIRTLRGLIHRRLQKRIHEHWYQLLFEVLLTYNYKMVSRSTGLTPSEARKKDHHMEAKLKMEEHARSDKK